MTNPQECWRRIDWDVRLVRNGRVGCVNKGGQVRLRVRTGKEPIGSKKMHQTEFSTAMRSDVGTLALMLPGMKELYYATCI